MSYIYIHKLSYNIYIFTCPINLAHTIIPSGTPCSPSCPIQRSSKAKNRLRSVVEGAGENFVTVGVEVQWDDLRLGRRISTNGAPGFGKFHVRTYVGLEIGRETNHWCGCLVSHIFWLVVYLPLWKKWVRQLGWWHPQYMEKIKKCSKPPTSLVLCVATSIHVYPNIMCCP